MIMVSLWIQPQGGSGKVLKAPSGDNNCCLCPGAQGQRDRVARETEITVSKSCGRGWGAKIRPGIRGGSKVLCAAPQGPFQAIFPGYIHCPSGTGQEAPWAITVSWSWTDLEGFWSGFWSSGSCLGLSTFSEFWFSLGERESSNSAGIFLCKLRSSSEDPSRGKVCVLKWAGTVVSWYSDPHLSSQGDKAVPFTHLVLHQVLPVLDAKPDSSRNSFCHSGRRNGSQRNTKTQQCLLAREHTLLGSSGECREGRQAVRPPCSDEGQKSTGQGHGCGIRPGVGRNQDSGDESRHRPAWEQWELETQG